LIVQPQKDFSMPIAKRCFTDSTASCAHTLQTHIEDPHCVRVVLFASPTAPTPDFSRSDGPETNLPLLAAISTYEIPGVGPINVVFDGLTMTAERRPRYLEVKNLLDVAQRSSKVHFSTERIPFTSGLDPEIAAQRMLFNGRTVRLTETTRPQYFSQLCWIAEERYP
jgi:hypothetical protein